MYDRKLNIAEKLKLKSHFLFGPRATGKATLLKRQLPELEKVTFDLLERDVFRSLLKDPKLLESVPATKITVIDEIQKIPFLLDEVHRLIEKDGRRFVLTGSSARKLRHGSANLLAGRAWWASLFPLLSVEIPDFELERYLQRGGLPGVYLSGSFEKELKSYLSLYLREEIKAEALTRNTESFALFLDAMGLSNGCEINLQHFASDCRVSPNTVKNYIEILEDTLIGFHLPAFRKTKKRKAITRSKHYLFDVGVANALKGQLHFETNSKAFGDAFEHFIVCEVRACISYKDDDRKLSFWRSVNQQEVDLLIGSDLALEVKSTESVSKRHVRGLLALQEEGLFRDYCVVSRDPHNREVCPGIRNVHWKTFIEELWTTK